MLALSTHTWAHFRNQNPCHYEYFIERIQSVWQVAIVKSHSSRAKNHHACAREGLLQRKLRGEDERGQMMEDVQALSEIFTDIDPNYIFEELQSLPPTPDRCVIVAEKIANNKNAPKRKFLGELDRSSCVSGQEKKFMDEIDVEEAARGRGMFANGFPDPGTASESVEYKELCWLYLKNEFTMISANHIRSILSLANGRYFLARSMLAEDVSGGEAIVFAGAKRRRKKGKREAGAKFLRKPRKHEEVPERIKCDAFHREYAYSHKEAMIRARKNEIINDHENRLAICRAEGLLLTCECCFEDEVLPEDMVECNKGHPFCKECVRRTANEVIGLGKFRVGCLHMAGCSEEFPLFALKESLPKSIFDGYERRVQERDIETAGLSGLERCPFCSYAVIMESKADSVFRCKSPACGLLLLHC
eukprot:jgi/Bigna1/87649/estExt_fgenesh1_pg.C_220172